MKSWPPVKVSYPELRTEQVAEGFRSGDEDSNKADVCFRESVSVQVGPCWAGHSLYFMDITMITARNYFSLQKTRVCSTQDYPGRGVKTGTQAGRDHNQQNLWLSSVAVPGRDAAEAAAGCSHLLRAQDVPSEAAAAVGSAGLGQPSLATDAMGSNVTKP